MHLKIICAGGEERVCLLDKEETVAPGTMRATGDWVNVNSEQLQYLGRRDRLIKRHGKRVNLDSMQQVSFYPAFFSLYCAHFTQIQHIAHSNSRQQSCESTHFLSISVPVEVFCELVPKRTRCSLCNSLKVALQDAVQGV